MTLLGKFFTLRVCEVDGIYVSYTKHAYGGMATMQQAAFSHLFPQGNCPWVYRELLIDLALAHNWEVELWDAETDKPSDKSIL